MAATPPAAGADLESKQPLPQQENQQQQQQQPPQEEREREIEVRLQAIGSARILRRDRLRLRAHQPFAAVVQTLRERLELLAAESLFCFLGRAFCPGMQATLGELQKLHGEADGSLAVQYCYAEAWG